MYTKKGDKGETSLFGPRRVPKDSPIVDAYGTIDELNSILGLIVSDCRDKKITSPLMEIQALLFVAGADAASGQSSSHTVPRLTTEATKDLEVMTDALLKALPPLRNFILPGGSRAGALLHIARTVCRRCERCLVAASKVEGMNPELAPFFNRLSTYLFDLSRYANLQAGRKETIWPRVVSRGSQRRSSPGRK